MNGLKIPIKLTVSFTCLVLVIEITKKRFSDKIENTPCSVKSTDWVKRPNQSNIKLDNNSGDNKRIES